MTREHEPCALVLVSFDLKQSIEMRGYQQPDPEILFIMKRAFEDWLWRGIEDHWDAIIEHTGFEFIETENGA